METRKDAREDDVTVLINTSTQKQEKLSGPHMLVETLMGAFIVIGSGYFILTSLGSAQLVFCLFCIFIFAIAIRANRNLAYSTGLMMALGYGLLIWHYNGMDSNVFMQATFLMQPFLLIVVSILGSDLLHNQRIEFYKAKMQLAQNQEKLVHLSQQLENVLESKSKLVQQLIEQEAPIASVCHQITQLWQLTDEERYRAIVDLVVQATGARSSALYLVQGDQFFLQASHSSQEDSYPSMLDRNDILIEKVLHHDQVYTIRELFHTRDETGLRPILSTEMPIMAGPLSKGKHILGIVIIGTMPLTKFTLSTTQLFSALLQLVSLSLEEATPSPASHPIAQQETPQNEKAQDINKVTIDDKLPIPTNIAQTDKMPLPTTVLDEEKTQKFSAIKRRHYIHIDKNKLRIKTQSNSY